MEQRTRRIIVWSIVGVVVVAAGVIGGVLWWLKSDVARPVAVDDVLADFRANASVDDRAGGHDVDHGNDDADEHHGADSTQPAPPPRATRPGRPRRPRRPRSLPRSRSGSTCTRPPATRGSTHSAVTSIRTRRRRR